MNGVNTKATPRPSKSASASIFEVYVNVLVLKSLDIHLFAPRLLHRLSPLYPTIFSLAERPPSPNGLAAPGPASFLLPGAPVAGFVKA